MPVEKTLLASPETKDRPDKLSSRLQCGKAGIFSKISARGGGMQTFSEQAVDFTVDMARFSKTKPSCDGFTLESSGRDSLSLSLSLSLSTPVLPYLPSTPTLCLSPIFPTVTIVLPSLDTDDYNMTALHLHATKETQTNSQHARCCPRLLRVRQPLQTAPEAFLFVLCHEPPPLCPLKRWRCEFACLNSHARPK